MVEVRTGSGSDRVIGYFSEPIDDRSDPVATAPGTDTITIASISVEVFFAPTISMVA